MYEDGDEIADCSTTPDGLESIVARAIAGIPALITASQALIKNPEAERVSTLQRECLTRELPPTPYSEDNTIIFDAHDRPIADVSMGEQPGFVAGVVLELPELHDAAKRLVKSAESTEEKLKLDPEAMDDLKSSLKTLHALKTIAEDRANS